MFLRRFVEYLRKRVTTTTVVSQSSASFLEDVSRSVAIDGKTLRFCYDRLGSLMKTLEIHNTDDYLPIQLVADFGTLIGTYEKGFAVCWAVLLCTTLQSIVASSVQIRRVCAVIASALHSQNTLALPAWL